mmetsp:Transcript_1470/g.3957  ORF Transcript_1470/g.3957 Transcript_1470/m.3957 type:complete len:260 (+) Transcript_1470:2059-2838(+)
MQLSAPSLPVRAAAAAACAPGAVTGSTALSRCMCSPSSCSSPCSTPPSASPSLSHSSSTHSAWLATPGGPSSPCVGEAAAVSGCMVSDLRRDVLRPRQACSSSSDLLLEARPSNSATREPTSWLVVANAWSRASMQAAELAAATAAGVSASSSPASAAAAATGTAGSAAAALVGDARAGSCRPATDSSAELARSLLRGLPDSMQPLLHEWRRLPGSGGLLHSTQSSSSCRGPCSSSPPSPQSDSRNEGGSMPAMPRLSR